MDALIRESRVWNRLAREANATREIERSRAIGRHAGMTHISAPLEAELDRLRRGETPAD